jgi:Fe-S oxidoreductase
VLWDDTFVRYHEPQIGVAAVNVLERAGFEVMLASGRVWLWPSGVQPGEPGARKKAGERNLALLNQDVDNAPILFLEPSCYSMFVEDYAELGLAGVEAVARRSYLFEQFLEELLAHEPDALAFNSQAGET